MLAQVVPVQQLPLHGILVRLQDHGVPVHERHFLQHHGAVYGVHSVRSPGEGAVAVYQHGGHLGGIDLIGCFTMRRWNMPDWCCLMRWRNTLRGLHSTELKIDNRVGGAE